MTRKQMTAAAFETFDAQEDIISEDADKVFAGLRKINALDEQKAHMEVQRWLKKS